MRVLLDEARHVYTLEDGRVVPGYSEIVSCVGTREKRGDGEFGPWRSIAGAEFCNYETAKTFGHEFHAYAQYRVQGIECDYDPAMEPWVQGFEKYLSDNPWILSPKNEMIVERPMYSTRFGYAGTPDLVVSDRAQSKGRVHLFDWKTTATMQKKSVRRQTAAYEELVAENFFPGKKLVRHAVRFFEYGYEEDVRKNNPEDWYAWLAVLNTYKLAA